MSEKKVKKGFFGLVKRDRPKKPRSKQMRILLKTLSAAGKILATLFLVGVITGCIVVTALTVYVMKFSDTTDVVDIESYKYSYSTLIYATDVAGNEVEVDKLNSGKNQTWVGYADIPQHVKDAFRCSEDIRFFDHEGVDWKRTFASFANLFLHFYDTRQGGSTITQQVIKNVTLDNDSSIPRKVREIFRAINTERKFTKAQILECYLNIIPLGGNNYGVQAAADYYFGKDVSELTIAEAAALAATTKSPNSLNVKVDPERNKERRNNYSLKVMYEDGVISEAEYQEALAEEVAYVEQTNSNIGEDGTLMPHSYFTDEIIREVIADLRERYGYDYDYARSILFNSGLRIYSTMDPDVQDILEEKYKNALTFYSNSKVKDPPQSAMIVYDYNGNMKAVVGGRGEKPGEEVLNRATMSKIGVGSAIKPLSTYSLAVDKNFVTWSTLIKDEPTIKDATGKAVGPSNYNKKKYGTVTVEYALRLSLNTIPVKLIKLMQRETCFDFMVNKLGISTLVKARTIEDEDGKSEYYSDIDFARLAMGSLVDGMKLSELANAYQIFGNGGFFNESTTYTKVTTADGKLLLEKKNRPLRAISVDSASVMNKLLQQVVEAPGGTGAVAKLSTHTVVGKTGTSNDDKSNTFVGLTPYYIGAVWVGYDTPKEITTSVTYKPVRIWKNVMEPIHKNLPAKEFALSTDMKQLKYCTQSGLIASDSCTKTAVGYYKSDNVPETCTGKH